MRPLLETMVEDKDAEREEEDDVGEVKRDKDVGAWSDEEAFHVRIQLRVDRGNVWMSKGAIGRHICNRKNISNCFILGNNFGRIKRGLQLMSTVEKIKREDYTKSKVNLVALK